MSDEQIPQPQVADVIALSQNRIATGRQEGVVNVLSKPAELERFTNIRKRESILHSKIIFRHKLIDAIGEWEEKSMEKGNGEVAEFKVPDLPQELMRPDWNLRTSEQGFMVKVFQHISHLVEGSQGSGRPGLFGRRKN